MAKITSQWSSTKYLEQLPVPATGQAFHRCPDEKYLAIRITATGGRAWIVEKKVEGKVKRRTLGDAPAPGVKGGMSLRDAVRERDIVLGQLVDGKDPIEARRAEVAKIEAEKREAGITFGDALTDYVARKVRRKDSLPLKESTKADYLRMIEAPHISKPRGHARSGSMTKPGELYPLINIGINHITGDDIRKLHTDLSKERGERRTAYAMGLLRAVLNWHGVKVPNNPMGADVAGKDRIIIPQARVSGTHIPDERLPMWWRAVPDTLPGDYLKFLLLTGCRASEPLKVLVRDCDMIGNRILIPDTKNRTDHTVLLSTQATTIVQKHVKGKKATDHLFDLTDAMKTLKKVREASGVVFTPKSLRKTFVSIANRKCNYIVAKRLVNHLLTGDVTATNYIHVDEEELRAGWQAVADFFEKITAVEATDSADGALPHNVVLIKEVA